MVYDRPIADATDDASEARALELAQRLGDEVATLFGDALTAVILHGSLVLGDFASGRSDVDLLAVVERPLTDDEIADLRKLMARSVTPRDPPVDFRTVTHAVAGRPVMQPPLEMYVRRGASGEHDLATRIAEPDLLVELSIARAHGLSLVGAESSTVIAPVPGGWVTAYGDEVLSRWQQLTDDSEHAELMVLTACRIWRLATDGVHVSKPQAGRWALARDPSLTAVAGALRRRDGEPEVDIGALDIARLLALVRGEIAQASAQQAPIEPPRLA